MKGQRPLLASRNTEMEGRSVLSKVCNIPTLLGKPLVNDNASLTSYKQVRSETHIQFCHYLQVMCPVVPFVEITYLWVSTSHPEPLIKVRNMCISANIEHWNQGGKYSCSTQYFKTISNVIVLTIYFIPAVKNTIIILYNILHLEESYFFSFT